MTRLGMNYWRADYSESCTVSSVGGRGKRAEQLVPRQRPTQLLKVSISDPVRADLRIKLDPGSKTTGVAVIDDQSGEVVFAAKLSHRGHKIKDSLDGRRAIRRSRRNRKTRYRKARWQNRRRKQGWLPPSLRSRIANVLTWVKRLSRFCHITSISLELVRFDMQLMENPVL